MGMATREQPYGVCDRCGKRSERAYYGTEWGGYSVLREKRYVLVGEEIVTRFFECLICRSCQDDFIAFFSQPMAELHEPVERAERVLVAEPAAAADPVPVAALPTAPLAAVAAVPRAPRRGRSTTATEAPATPRTAARRPRPANESTKAARSA